jgi:hypothetical protein
VGVAGGWLVVAGAGELGQDGQQQGRVGGVVVVEQAADQRLDPAQRPPLVMSEPVR